MGSSVQKDKRHHERQPLQHVLHVVHPYSREVIGTVINISQGGLMVSSTQPIPIGWQIELKIVCPKETLLNPILFNAISRWCQQDINPKYYDVGLEFIHPTAGLINSIKSLMEYLRSQGTMQRGETKKPISPPTRP